MPSGTGKDAYTGRHIARHVAEEEQDSSGNFLWLGYSFEGCSCDESVIDLLNGSQSCHQRGINHAPGYLLVISPQIIGKMHLRRDSINSNIACSCLLCGALAQRDNTPFGRSIWCIPGGSSLTCNASDIHNTSPILDVT